MKAIIRKNAFYLIAAILLTVVFIAACGSSRSTPTDEVSPSPSPSPSAEPKKELTSRLVNLHGEKDYFGPGVYYAHDIYSISSTGGSFRERLDADAILKQLLDNDIAFKEAWYKPYASSCCAPGSEVCLQAIVESALVVRLANEDARIEQFGFKKTDNPTMGFCSYYVRHYFFSTPEQPKDASTGVLLGKVSIGPLCPVEIEGVPCKVPPGTYTSQAVFIYREDGTTLVTSVHLNECGYYRFELPPGVYAVDLLLKSSHDSAWAVESRQELPKKIEIRVGAVAELNLRIDTGIR